MPLFPQEKNKKQKTMGSFQIDKKKKKIRPDKGRHPEDHSYRQEENQKICNVYAGPFK